jgi:hypothetical protein
MDGEKYRKTNTQENYRAQYLENIGRYTDHIISLNSLYTSVQQQLTRQHRDMLNHQVTETSTDTKEEQGPKRTSVLLPPIRLLPNDKFTML